MRSSGWSGAGSSSSRSTNPPYTSRPSASPIRSELIARVEPSLTRVLSPVPSTRTHPVTVTSPDGGAGTSSTDGTPSEESVARKPRSTTTAVPSAVTSGTTTSTPDEPSSPLR